KLENTEIIQYFNRTNSTATLLDYENGKEVKESFINQVKDIAGNDKTLLVVSMEVSEKIKELLPENIKVIHYGSIDAKGSNEFKDYQKVICTLPKVNKQA